jgi:hypothetical protein
MSDEQRRQTVSSGTPPRWRVEDYELAAQQYMGNLQPCIFVDDTAKTTQRIITLASFALLKCWLDTLQDFNELLVQYFVNGRLRRLVPDNCFRLSKKPLLANSTFAADLEEDKLFMVLEYVSAHSLRKDYWGSFRKYERELKVPYCLMFYPERQDLRLHHHTGKGYERVTANAAGRYPVPELELEVGLLGGWVRYWFRGQLLKLPADLQQQIDETTQRLQQAEKRAEQERQRAEQERQRAEQERQQREAAEAEVARLKALLDQLQQPKPGNP